jgi:hypothetical protein
MEEVEKQFVTSAPRYCSSCRAPLCLRKQVVNLALGNTDEMFCLVCLGAESSRSPQEVVANLTGYIMSRECFRKEWVRYKDVSYCPDPMNCCPNTCFPE